MNNSDIRDTTDARTGISDLQHKVTKVLGYFAAGVIAIFAVTMFMPNSDVPVPEAILFSLLAFGVFMLARASARELKRRRGQL